MPTPNSGRAGALLTHSLLLLFLRRLQTLLLLLLAASSVTGFVLRAPSFVGRRSAVRDATVESVAEDTSTEDPKLLPRERYVATNRFEVRKGKEAAFEKR